MNYDSTIRYMKQKMYGLILGATVLFFCILSVQQATGQETVPFIDMHNFGASKAYGSRSSVKVSPWSRVEHDCSYDFQPAFIDAFRGMGKRSQANFEALIRAEAPLTCISFSPLQKPFLKSELMDPGELKGTLSCLTGVVATDAIGFVSDIDYFGEFVKFYSYLKDQETRNHEMYGQSFSFKMIDKLATLNEVIENPNKLGVVLTLSGGHVLGHSLYIENGLTAEKEYISMIANNIKRLKGELPIYENTEEYMTHPVLFISLASYFPNGICGASQTFDASQSALFAQQTHIDRGMTRLGSTLVSMLLAKDSGRRILVDVSQMSLNARMQYYAFVGKYRDIGDVIPIVASHVGISGRSWDDVSYKDAEKKPKFNSGYLRHSKLNLSRQDIMNIYDSNGLIGISLNQLTVCGPQIQKQLEGTIPGSSQYRSIYLKALLANIFTVIDVVQNRSAWDMVTIGSDFDSICKPFPMYGIAEEIPDLMEDMHRFFSDPEDIFNLFSENEVRQLMFNYTADELVHKLFNENALQFLKENLPDDTLARFKK